jgi:hypothetical protein
VHVVRGELVVPAKLTGVGVEREQRVLYRLSPSRLAL